jgi:ABC-type polysaccharide/polyol phosphate export permease
MPEKAVSMIKEIISRKDLIRELVLKNLKIRYSKSALGFLWVFLSPFLIVLIFYLVFSLILNVRTKEAPFILYLMSGVFTWRFFQESLVSATTSLVDNKNLIREASFPHYLIPVSIVLSALFDFLPALFILLAASLFVLKGLPLFILFLPVILLIHLAMCIGLSIILSVLYVKWRDIKHILDAVLLLLFYLTPAFYSIYLVKDSFPVLLFKVYIYNPFVGILNLYRFSILKGFFAAVRNEVDMVSVLFVPLLFAIAVLLCGFLFYRKNKNIINDYLAY